MKILLLTLIFGLAGCGGLSRGDTYGPPSEPAELALIPTTPVPGFYKDHPRAWMKFHETFLARGQKGNIGLLFLGDSITQGWEAQEDLWQEAFGAYRPANFGIGGDKTQNVLWRLENGEVAGLRPRGVVLLVGVNNLWSGQNSAEEIAGGIKKVVVTLREKLPDTSILVLGIFSTQEKPENPLREKVRAINALVAKIADGPRVRYQDLGPRFLEPDGSISKEIMPDFLHLSGKGYALWAEALKAPLAELCR